MGWSLGKSSRSMSGKGMAMLFCAHVKPFPVHPRGAPELAGIDFSRALVVDRLVPREWEDAGHRSLVLHLDDHATVTI